MQVVTLSDHTGDKVRQTRQSREAAYAREREAHADKVRHFEAVRHGIWQRAGAAWKARRMGAFLVASISVVANALQRRPAAPRIAAASDQERIWEAGDNGEAQVLAMLGSQLGPEWTTLTGYKNHKGEGDLLLVGPLGVLGVEIKNMSGVVSCQGDLWLRDKYDNYGNCVERNVPIKDRGGRSPSQQINEVCTALGAFLLKRHQQPTILTAVVLAHPKGKVGNISNPTLNFVGRMESLDVAALFRRCGSSGRSHDGDALVRLIAQDHACHAHLISVKSQLVSKGQSRMAASSTQRCRHADESRAISARPVLAGLLQALRYRGAVLGSVDPGSLAQRFCLPALRSSASVPVDSWFPAAVATQGVHGPKQRDGRHLAGQHELPLRLWWLAIYLVTQAKNGIAALEMSRQLGVCYRTAWRLKHRLMNVMADQEVSRQLTGWIQIDDAYLGGERARGPGEPQWDNKIPFIAAISTDAQGHPQHMRLDVVSSFRRSVVQAWASNALGPGATVLSDGLTAFTGVTGAGFPHEAIICGRGRQAVQQPRLRWVNTILGNLKTSFSGAHHALKFATYAARYLRAHAYRFNRRFDLPAMLIDLAGLLLRSRTHTEGICETLLRLDANQAMHRGYVNVLPTKFENTET